MTGNERIFDGKTYHIQKYLYSKSEANSFAEMLRKHGMSARVTKATKMASSYYNEGKRIPIKNYYAVWGRK